MLRFILCASLLLTGCSTVVKGEPSASSDVDGYLVAIAEHLPGSSSQAYLDVGTATCDRLRSGKTSDEVVQEKIDNGLTPFNARIVVHTSIQYLCSEFKDR